MNISVLANASEAIIASRGSNDSCTNPSTEPTPSNTESDDEPKVRSLPQHRFSPCDASSVDTDRCESDGSPPNCPLSDVALPLPVTGAKALQCDLIQPCSLPKKRRTASSFKTLATLADQPQNDASAKLRSLVDSDNFPVEALLDLAGTKSAKPHEMNDEERALVNYKRLLRNCESAQRSRGKRQATLTDIQTELDDLRQVSSALVEKCMTLSQTNDLQSQEIETLHKENHLLESLLRGSHSQV